MTDSQIVITSIVGATVVSILITGLIIRIFHYIDLIGSHANGDTPNTRERSGVHSTSGRKIQETGIRSSTDTQDEGKSRI